MHGAGTSPPDGPKGTTALLAKLSTPRAGVVGRTRAVNAGVPPQAIDYRRGSGGLHDMFDGIYSVGHAPTTDLAWFFAAIEAAGESSKLTHLSSVRYWRLLEVPLHPIHITMPRNLGPCRRDGIECHRPVDQHPWDFAIVDGLPISSVQRALLESTPYLTDNQLALAIHKARVEQRVSLPSIKRMLDRAPKARGRNRFHAIAFGKQLPPGKLERRMRTLVQKAGLQDYERNVFVSAGGRDFLVDCFWREHRLVYEIDDASHLTAHKAAKDREQTNLLEDAGFRVRRVAESDLYPFAKRTMARLARQLDHRAHKAA